MASSGAVELAPAAQDETLIVQKDLASLSGFYLAARQAGISKDLSAAAGFYASALQADPDNAELLDRSVLLNIASGNIAKAAELAEPLLEIEPDDQLALLASGVASFRAGDTEAALAHTQALRDLGGPLQALVGSLLQAWTIAGDGRPAEAIKLLDDLEGPIWIDPFKKIHAGLIADQFNLYEISEDRLRLAYEQDATDVRLVEAYARTLARAGKTDRAVAVLDALAEQVPAIVKLIDPVRTAVAGDGEVAPLADNARAGMAEALYSLGRGIGSNDTTLSASLLQLSLYLRPEADFPAMALGGILEGMRQHEAAILVYSSIPQDTPLYREAQVQEALNLNVLERHEEAIAALKSLLANDPSDVQVALALGNVYRQLEDFKQAGEIYTASIDNLGTVPEEYWTLYYYRGIANERTDNWKGAEADFRKALELSPEHPLVLNYLGYSYIDRGENLDEAVSMVQRAVKQQPDDGYIVDSLGWAYYRLGRYEDAVEQLERAVSLRAGDPVINDHLGDAYWKVGRKLEAMFQWNHARDSDPEPDDLQRILTKLAVGLDAADAAPHKATAVAEDTGAEPEPATAQ
ncbi:tetratricopeptide repeat protein [Acuticoccus sp. MNP-M23]|uniref:tetratricopeptide repeat protein n=1 Tax=Acuticoccus sp. MNP-M23 TaxID=3072793 RepID=UPI0028161F75|nr:tetratricopeptide repeat protein [Acuticoccus sp. MNP-M23]WMS44999.1 tetratricopeptide repeat protein [Acuticoccus sp. MNP-M23]